MALNHKQGILIIDDSPEDIETTVEAFRNCNCKIPIYHFDNGDTALEFLFTQRELLPHDENKITISLVLLDLNMPGTDGKEILKEIKNNPLTRSIPVNILTTSKSPDDIAACYSLGANSYLYKSVDWQTFLETIHVVHQYWFNIARLG